MLVLFWRLFDLCFACECFFGGFILIDLVLLFDFEFDIDVVFGFGCFVGECLRALFGFVGFDVVGLFNYVVLGLLLV